MHGSTSDPGGGEGRLTDSNNPDAIIGDVFLLFGMIVEVLEFALLGEVINTSAAFSDIRESA